MAREVKIFGVPTLRDPRCLLFLFFAVLLYYVISEPGFARTWVHFFTSFGICMALDVAYARWLQKRWIFPMSGLITAFGVFILIDSPLLWPTALAAALAVSSKHLIRVRGQHLFNPNNFGVVAVCWAFPDWAVTSGHRWAGKFSVSVILACVGAAVVWRARRWLVSGVYLLSFFIINVGRAFYFGKPWWSYSLSLLGPGMQLFLFYMISDPRTSPDDRRRQVLFGVCLAALDNTLRHFELRDSPIYSVFLVCLGFNLYRAYRPDRIAFSVWQTRDTKISGFSAVVPEFKSAS